MTRVVITALEPGSHLVRIHPDEATPYDRAIVVTEFDDILFLRLWIGKPLSPSEWITKAGEHFPKARWALWKRGHGEHAELHRVRIPRKEVI